MAKTASVDGQSASVFKTFPEFSKLRLADRGRYERLIKDLPPGACYSFVNLMVWWNALDCCAISRLNKNLVLSYWIPGQEDNSGLSIIGKNRLDESICCLFDYQKAEGKPARLVHIPEFVIQHIQHPELYSYTPEPHTDEYVLALNKYYPLDNASLFRRYRIQRFQKSYPDARIEVKSLDLSLEDNTLILMGFTKKWHDKAFLKNFVKHMDEAMETMLNRSASLGTKNLCLYVNGQLQAFLLYFETNDPRYVTLTHAIFCNKLFNFYDYAVYAFAKRMTELGVTYVNVDSDIGLPVLRMIKLALGPDHYFRYYTVEPVADSGAPILQPV